MPNVSERLRRLWRFVRLNWRNFIVIGISIVGAIGFIWGVFQIFNSPLNGMTVLYGFLIFAGGMVFHVARTSKLGRIDFLMIEDDD